ncbi:MAG TPA: cytosine permease [Anaeromyxobacter sp.]|nr:cytosine permease [Anaeromyxobacter sp.]
MSSTTGRVAHADEAPFTLEEAPPRPLGLYDQAALWGNLGITLTIPVAAAFVLRPSEGLPPLTLGAAVTAVLVGTVLGTVVLALSAVPGTDTGAPAMVLLRGLLGRRGSFLPTVLNIAQCVGWAAVEVLVIADGSAKLVPSVPHSVWAVGAGALATALALWPLGFVRTLRRYAVWLVIASSIYLFVEVLRHGLTPPEGGSWRPFWLSVDVVVALPISWAPLAADYSRHSRRARDAFGGALGGFGLAAIAYFLLGLFAIVAMPQSSSDPIGALLAVPAGALAVAILVLDEIDEAFANLYSTALSAQNLKPTLDRRVVALLVGLVATALALLTDMTQYENFLLLIGSVFVPLFAVLLVDYFLLRGRVFDVGPLAPPRPVMALPWLLGFVVYQLLNPGTVPGWSTLWTRGQALLHLSPPPPWLSASLTSFVVAALVTLAVAPLEHPRVGRAGRERS